jgi:cation diffusion facilitator family transporter
MHLQTIHQKIMLRAVSVSFFGNIILFFIKLAALLLVRSLAIATDLGITVVGLIVSAVLYYSIKLASRPADMLHNYGYGKVEHVCEALEGVVLIGIALLMTVQAIGHIVHPHAAVANPWVGFTFSVVGCVINFIGAYWILALAQKCHSPAVKAEGVHYKLEGFISLTVSGAFLVTAILALTPLAPWGSYLDPIATLMVALLITWPSFQLAKHAFLKLLDVSLEESGKIEMMGQLAQFMDRTCEFRDVRSRTAGRTTFVELKLVLPKVLSFVKANEFALEVSRDLQKSIPHSEASVKGIPCAEDCSYLAEGQPCPYLEPLQK